jgi:hypothetical protein
VRASSPKLCSPHYDVGPQLYGSRRPYLLRRRRRTWDAPPNPMQQEPAVVAAAAPAAAAAPVEFYERSPKINFRTSSVAPRPACSLLSVNQRQLPVTISRD